MKRLRTSRCSGQLLSAQTRASSSCTKPISLSLHRATPAATTHLRPSVRSQSTVAPAFEDAVPAAGEYHADPFESEPPYPSPLPERALSSPKLAALHARLSLPSKLPLQTLTRCLVDPSADPNPHFNNANLALVGSSLLSYLTSERLVVSYPRLPMAVLFEAMRAYAGPAALANVARSWGIDQAAAPGPEVDPGLLQFSLDPAAGVRHTRWGYVRKEAAHLDKFRWRRGLSSRTVLDDEFGDTVHKPNPNPREQEDLAADPQRAADLAAAERQSLRDEAHAAVVRAVVGALYIHAGRDAAHAFVRAHILSRHVDLERLFSFKLPTRELAMLCAREGFEPPVARLLSETGRRSRTPVFVVGIYSGRDLLGEGTGASLDFARQKACMNALKAWYLYSPGQNVRVPSDMLSEGAKKWEPVYVDIGEVI
ncbi:54S ribosomal protein L3 [Sodiomyces alkalinus F11]|uniref:Large ribosomal subunit protein mL44 n=1 Tax=Sodiomyces alkalinus (strain CBS 110278 / VKM F-3762 / F11) TaxID=1314773 RepID=A0A3N2Q8D9_SODAK|nr:54S ribosomal protein L3 [Sodiomyces alkalinus F11]ROT43041.1 54S ribosomal protein L3 [Sodiomyces alkalinus F11]